MNSTALRTPQVRKYYGNSGVTILQQNNSSSRAFCIGVWTKTGSRDEARGEEGLCHFLEHMLFKGTVHRNAFEIVHRLESLGGGLDGFTSRDLTCYYARCLDEHAPVAIEVLADMSQYSRLDPDEIEKEKRVVLEEIQSVEDTPDDWIHDLFAKSVWGTHPIAEPIQGTPQYVVGFTRERLCRYLERHYVPERIVIAAAGNLEYETLVDLVRRWFVMDGRGASLLERNPPAFTEQAVLHYRKEIG